MNQYALVITDSSTKLEEQVTAMLRSGWKCQGGIAIAYDTFTDRDHDICSSATYAQAMIK